MGDEHRYLTETLRGQLMRLERVLSADVHLAEDFEDTHLPAWLRRTEGEQRVPVSVAVLAAIVLQIMLPGRFALRPHLLLPALEGALLVGLAMANPVRINRESTVLRATSLSLLAVISLGNAVSAVLLVRNLVDGNGGNSAGALLGTGVAIWGTNVIAFALWYWELDRGGPAARAKGGNPYPDFLFTQMTAPELSPPNWEPAFLDYLYLSFTNATAFSPTDVMPLSRWAKMMMLFQSAVSIVAVALVISRAVNIFK
ncbi:hypothetical protein GCM10027176_58290 [Actinoallomurus bryophytorum]|uniref:Putative membrane protein n=1 Tax=Actinoallomurus bryophytorum TaxID=1490222 RepID=A0A543CCR8_9ACTN|nr:DUF1345 domain-containing protein [Actinoallomurus bryophytorum]TQL94892.1 putative membrane protein [Actinoallomurus bryophytorum]